MMQRQLLFFTCITAFIIALPTFSLAADTVSIKGVVDALKDGIGTVGNFFGKAYEAEIPTSVFSEFLSLVFFIIKIVISFWACTLVGLATSVIFTKAFALILFLCFRLFFFFQRSNNVLERDLKKSKAIETSLFYQNKTKQTLSKIGFYIGFGYAVILVFVAWQFNGNLDYVIFYALNPLALL